MAYFHLHQLKKLRHNFDLVIPFVGFKAELEKELGLKKIKILFQHPRFILIESSNKQILWAQDHWEKCQITDDSSYASAELESKLTYYYNLEKNLNAQKIIKKIKTIPEKRITYPLKKRFDYKYSSWLAIDDLIIFSHHPKSRYPLGWHEFNEDKATPPNRAYLKLWEAITVEDLKFDSTTNAIEIGASPGGWSWELSRHFNKVFTIDRSDLAPQVKKIKNIHHQIGDAFKLNPKNFDNVSWFFSDLICSPDKIYETIRFWLDNSPIQNFVCTIKFKGETDYETVEKLLKIPESKIVKLYHNKHEATWIKQGK